MFSVCVASNNVVRVSEIIFVKRAAWYPEDGNAVNRLQTTQCYHPE